MGVTTEDLKDRGVGMPAKRLFWQAVFMFYVGTRSDSVDKTRH